MNCWTWVLLALIVGVPLGMLLDPMRTKKPPYKGESE